MDIKERLEQYRKAMIYAERCFSDLESLTMIKSPGMTGMPRGSTRGDNLERIAVRMIQAKERAEKARERVLREMDEIEEMIESLEDYEQRAVLRLRYIRGFTWDQVGTTIHRSERTVFRIHGAALAELRRRQ